MTQAKQSALGGLSMGFFLSGALQPLEVIRTQMIVNGRRELGSVRQLLATVEQVYRQHGLGGFWRGAGM